MMNMNRLSEKRDHVVRLSKDMKVKLTVGREFKSSVRYPLIMIKGVSNDEDYAATLHEFGHQYYRSIGFNIEKSSSDLCCPRHMSDMDMVAILIQEYNAWAWAKQNAIEWNNAMEEEYRYSFSSYMRMSLDVLKNVDNLVSAINQYDRDEYNKVEDKEGNDG